jgi:hypothetical protein
MHKSSLAGRRRLTLVLWPAVICAVMLSAGLWLGLWPAGAPRGVLASDQAGTVQATPAPLYALVVLEWTTKSEVNTAGFNMYRAESSGGPFLQINRELIASAGDPIAGGHYVYTDTEAVAGRTYYYQLEDVELSGNRTRHETITTTARSAALAIGGVDATLALYGFGAVSLVTGLGFVLWRILRH